MFFPGYPEKMPEISPELQHKLNHLLDSLKNMGRVAVAFSAGVDSTVVAKAAQLACGDQAVAVTSVSPSLASGEQDQAEQLAEQIGIRHLIIETEEFSNQDYLKNESNRCYFCKTELYTQLESRIVDLGVDVILNGANLDDLGDHRPGMQAASEHHVRSPLLESQINKQEVRELAHYWDLPVWDKPATPCLSSRIAYGVEVTPDRVRLVDQAEQLLKQELNLTELRVRLEANDLARIELPYEELSQFIQSEKRERLTQILHDLGFKYVTLDLDGFRSGSMNAVVPLQQWRSSEQ